MSDFLFELGVEEVPVSYVKEIKIQLCDLFASSLKKAQIEYDKLEVSSTNRRFTLYINKISVSVKDKHEQLIGPSKSISFDEKGNPTKALQKFMQINNASKNDLLEIETKKGEYIGLDRLIEGGKTKDILKNLIPSILKKFSFSKTMIWNSSGISFVRPIRNILAILNGDIVKFEFAGITSSGNTYGHLLLSDNRLKIRSFKDYCELLYKNFVIFRDEERKEKILNEIKEVEDDMDAKVKLDSKMLDYYIYNNEYPVVFTGSFEKQYLELPSEIISAFMINEKKLLPLYDKFRNLTNNFIGVSNIPDESGIVSEGNSKVIKATFEDAKFFWDMDKKENFPELRSQLKNVTFHKDLGTYFDKTSRLVDLTKILCEKTKNNQLIANLKEAAMLCKNDLISRMVREFPSLQGIMGGLYLKEMNFDDNIWRSVYFHYEPKGFVEDELEDLGGGILSIADKIDNISGLISKGIKISSSKDPYGIRRDTSAIIKVILDFKLNFNLKDIVVFSIDSYGSEDKNLKNEFFEKIRQLFINRMEFFFRDILFFNHDIVKSVLSSFDLSIFNIYLKAKSLTEMNKTSTIEHLVILHKRLRNIIKDSKKYEISEDLFELDEEKLLFDIFSESKSDIEKLIKENKFIQACSKILEMKPVIDNFFDNVLVMHEQEKVRQNRIALLQTIDILLSGIADFSVLTDIR